MCKLTNHPQKILSHVQGCCADPNWLWDEEVQEKECPDVKWFHLCCQSKEKIVKNNSCSKIWKRLAPWKPHLGGALWRLLPAPVARPNSSCCCLLALTGGGLCWLCSCVLLCWLWCTAEKAAEVEQCLLFQGYDRVSSWPVYYLIFIASIKSKPTDKEVYHTRLHVPSSWVKHG